MLPKTLKQAIAIILLSVFVAPSAVSAKSPSQQIIEVQQIAKWAQGSNALTQKILSVFDTPEFNALFAAVHDYKFGEDDEAELTAQFRDWRNNNAAFFLALEAEVAARPRPPQLSALALRQNSYDAMYDLTGEMFASTKIALSQTETFFKRAIAGDSEGLDKIRAIQINSIINLLNNENIGLINALEGSDKSHPHSHLGQIGIHSNEFIMAMMRIKVDYLEGNTDFASRSKHIQDMETSTQKSLRSIQRGEKAAAALINALEKDRAVHKTDSDIHNFNLVLNLVQSYTASFSNERDFTNIQIQMRDISNRDDNFAVLEAELDALVDVQTELLEIRSSQQEVRLSQLTQMR